MAPNKVLQKKKTVDQNLKLAIIKEQEEPISFGVNGTSLNLGASGVIDTREEEKERVTRERQRKESQGNRDRTKGDERKNSSKKLQLSVDFCESESR